MNLDEVKHLCDRIKSYGKAAHEAWKNGDTVKADDLHRKAEDALSDLYKHLGIE